jgi:hypothetical protein
MLMQQHRFLAARGEEYLPPASDFGFATNKDNFLHAPEQQKPGLRSEMKNRATPICI